MTPLVFVCSPYAGEVARNVRYASELCRMITELGGIAMCPPLLYPQFYSDDQPGGREAGMTAAKWMLRRSEILLRSMS